MKRVVWAAPYRAELIDVEDPTGPVGAEEIEGPTISSVISPGTELGIATFAPPVSLGYAACFRATKVGADAPGFEPGDVIFCMGGHSSWQRAHYRHAWVIPAGLAPGIAPFARLLAVSLTTLTTTAARPSDRVVVSGLGAIGNLAAQAFASCGYQVLGIDPAEGRRKLCPVPTASEWPKFAQGEEPALVVDCSGHEAAVLAACQSVRQGGEVVMVGVPWVKRTDITAHAILHEVFHRYVNLRSGWEWQVPHLPAAFRTGSIDGNVRTALRWIAEGRVNVEGLAEVVNPADCAAAYTSLRSPDCPVLTYQFNWN